MKTERCQLCDEPTGRCGEDSIYIEIRDGRHIGPLCVECMDGIIHWVASEDCISPNQQALATKDAEIERLNKMRTPCPDCGADYLATGVEAGCPCKLKIATLKGLLRWFSVPRRIGIEYARGYRPFCTFPICKWLKDRIRAALAEPPADGKVQG